MTAEFCLSVSLSHLKGSKECNILQHGADNFTSPLKEVALQIFVALRCLLFTARFEPVNFGHYIIRFNDCM
jgi:hypothetical protein